MLSVELTHGTGHSDTLMETTSSPTSSMRDWPSNDTNAGARAVLPLVILRECRNERSSVHYNESTLVERARAVTLAPRARER